MKTHQSIAVAALLCLSAATTFGQFGPSGGSKTAQFSGSITKLFGSNTAFSATVSIQTQNPNSGEPMNLTGKMAFDGGKSRFEMDMTQMFSGKMPPEALSQMKSMGLSQMISISVPDKKIINLIYPDAKAYVQMPLQDAGATNSPADFKMETTELGKETLDAHPCVKNKAVVTDPAGTKTESTVWNATDLKNFPIKIVQNEEGKPVTVAFKDISFAKPDAAQFAPPSDCTKYDDMQALIQEIMAKRLGGMPPSGK